MLTIGQAPVSTAAAYLAQVPPGPGRLLVSAGTSTAVYVGLGSLVTTGNGYPVPAGGLSLPLFAGGGASQLYAIAEAGTVAVSWIISNSTGQTGF